VEAYGIATDTHGIESSRTVEEGSGEGGRGGRTHFS
jgi:hypothetical protein